MNISSIIISILLLTFCNASYINKIDIRDYLHHRYPFLLVDKVDQFEHGESIVAIKNVTYNEPFFNGHFPQKPVMPGVLMVEALAQASGLLISLTEFANAVDDIGLFYLAGVDNTRFKRLVVPGDVLKLNVKVLKKRKKLWKFAGTVTVDGELACSCEFMNMEA